MCAAAVHDDRLYVFGGRDRQLCFACPFYLPLHTPPDSLQRFVLQYLKDHGVAGPRCRHTYPCCPFGRRGKGVVGVAGGKEGESPGFPPTFRPLPPFRGPPWASLFKESCTLRVLWGACLAPPGGGAVLGPGACPPGQFPLENGIFGPWCQRRWGCALPPPPPPARGW